MVCICSDGEYCVMLSGDCGRYVLRCSGIGGDDTETADGRRIKAVHPLSCFRGWGVRVC